MLKETCLSVVEADLSTFQLLISVVLLMTLCHGRSRFKEGNNHVAFDFVSPFLLSLFKFTYILSLHMTCSFFPKLVTIHSGMLAS